jgi:hypothetical protein
MIERISMTRLANGYGVCRRGMPGKLGRGLTPAEGRAIPGPWCRTFDRRPPHFSSAVPKRPSKEEYVRAFEASGELPRPVQARVRRVIEFLAGIAQFFDLTD